MITEDMPGRCNSQLMAIYGMVLPVSAAMPSSMSTTAESWASSTGGPNWAVSPREFADLADHNLIGFHFGRAITLPSLGKAQIGDGGTARQLVLAGVGMARLALFHVGPDIAAGRLARCWSRSIPARWKRFTRSMSAKAGSCPRGSGRCWIYWSPGSQRARFS